MIIRYGSFAYFLPIVILAAAVVLLYFALRKASSRAKSAAVFVLAVLNIIQHIFKQFIWPHYFGDPYPATINTAYNMCATLILITPFVLLSRSSAWKQFMTYVGTAAGALTFVVPYWYIGGTLFQWDVLRYYACHGLLLATSLLPALWGLHKIKWRDFYKLPFMFFSLLIFIAFNYMVCWALGINGGGDGDFFEILYNSNPLWMMHPGDNFTFIVPVIDLFTPDIFFGDGTRPYTPILWYAIPLTLAMWIFAFAFDAIIDRRRFVADCSASARALKDMFFGVTPVLPLSRRVKYRAPKFRYKRYRRR